MRRNAAGWVGRLDPPTCNHRNPSPTPLPLPARAPWLQDTWARAQVASNGSSPVWQGMALILAQFDGLMDGYNAVVPAADRLTPFQFQQVNAVGDFIDLVSALSFDDDAKVRAEHDWFAMNSSTFARRQRETTHCSSLIKLDGDFQNLWFAHVAWFAFQATLRIFKHYDFSALANPAVKGGVMSFS